MSADVSLIVVFVLSLLFSLAGGALFLTHTVFILTNQTTIESMEKRNPVRISGERENVFDLGWEENVREILGDDPKLWLLPIWTSKGDGVHFKTNCDV